MAVVDIKESWEHINSSETQDQGTGAIVYTAARCYTVQFNNIDPANVSAALEATDGVTTIPAIGAAYSGSALYTYLHRKYPILTPNPYLIGVVCDYAGKGSPLPEPWEYSWPVEESSVEVSADIHGNAYVDPLGYPIFGLTRQVGDRDYVISRNEASNVHCRDRTWIDVVNSSNVTLGGLTRRAGTVLLRSTGQRIVRGPSYFYKLTYNMRMREAMWGILAANVWKRRLLCYGNYYWDGTAPKATHIEETVNPTTGTFVPRKLKTDGQLLPDAAPDEFNYWDECESADFNLLGLN